MTLLTRFDKWDSQGVYNNHNHTFSYNYSPGTNRLEDVVGVWSAADRVFTYDGNGNLLTDDSKDLDGTIYGRANLPTELRVVGGTQETNFEQGYFYDVNDMRVVKEKVNGLAVEDIDVYIRDYTGRELATAVTRFDTGNDDLTTTWNYYVFGSDRAAKIEPEGGQAPTFNINRFSSTELIDENDIVTQQIKTFLTDTISYPVRIAYGYDSIPQNEYVFLYDYYLDEIRYDSTSNFVLRQDLTIKKPSELLSLDRTGGTGTITISIDNLINGGTGNPGYRSEIFYGQYYEPDFSTDMNRIFYYAYDHLGNTRAVFKFNECTADKYDVQSLIDYYPYGKVLREYHQTNERYQTTQHERDNETGFDYRGARYYDSELGRFLGLDVFAADFASYSPYCYVLCNPNQLVDPDGKSPDPTIDPKLLPELFRAIIEAFELEGENRADIIYYDMFNRGSEEYAPNGAYVEVSGLPKHPGSQNYQMSGIYTLNWFGEEFSFILEVQLPDPKEGEEPRINDVGYYSSDALWTSNAGAKDEIRFTYGQHNLIIIRPKSNDREGFDKLRAILKVYVNANKYETYRRIDKELNLSNAENNHTNYHDKDEKLSKSYDLIYGANKIEIVFENGVLYVR